MPIKYDLKGGIEMKPSPLDAFPDGAEQEHADSCDINKMINQGARGLQLRGGGSTTFGEENMSMTGLQHRINLADAKENLRATINELQETEISESEAEALQQLPEYKDVKFKVRKKQAEKNDDQTTNTNASKNAPTSTPTLTPPKDEKSS